VLALFLSVPRTEQGQYRLAFQVRQQVTDILGDSLLTYHHSHSIGGRFSRSFLAELLNPGDPVPDRILCRGELLKNPWRWFFCFCHTGEALCQRRHFVLIPLLELLYRWDVNLLCRFTEPVLEVK